ncbi:anti-sigma factor RsiW [Thermocatellispora tengchongensis]|uniref:Anti-sigma factor RsiW n=1 Tax=Thermocatellispora tengchongensis TaxID=1073253 RepID=A0A840NX09_9ACTN|nr:anti-sigma factor [Thermocatellispora tengchongensis]MBB5131329.1 anti-sigma factor RsiW [Thermocatellispora tengchongensis]
MKRFRCQELVELATAYVDRELDEPARLGFEDHMAECLPCARYVDQFRMTVHALGHLPFDEPPATLSEHTRSTLLAAFRATRPKPPESPDRDTTPPERPATHPGWQTTHAHPPALHSDRPAAQSD